MILAIDCGSTNHKVALFNEELQRLSTCSIPVAYTLKDAERVEFEPEGIWQATLALIRRACVLGRVQPGQITTVALTSQAQTFTLIDPHGQPIVPFLSWADKRAQEESAELSQRMSEGFHRHCSFPAPLPQLQLSKLLWLTRRLPPQQRARTKVVALPGFLALRLAGLHCSDSNLAAMSGLYSLTTRSWWPAALAACGMAEEEFGCVVEPGAALGAQTRCANLDLCPELRMVLAGNDHTAGAYANGIQPEQLVLTLGTALVAYRLAGTRAGPFQAAGCWGPFPGGGFYELLTRDEGCAALDWAIAYSMPGDEPGFLKLAAMAPCGTALFYPQRMRAPDAWEGSTEPAARARAVLEGICFSLRQLVEELAPPTGARNAVTVIGGGSANPFWLRLLANVLNRPVRQGRADNLLGAAMLARPGITPPQEAQPICFLPESKRVEEYEQVYQQWQQPAPSL